jgi:hypothetical protein
VPGQPLFESVKVRTARGDPFQQLGIQDAQIVEARWWGFSEKGVTE